MPMSRTLLPAATLVIAALFAGCTVQTTGMQAPLPHDYDAVEWLPLNEPVEQLIIVAPGYAAAVENDPEVTPQALRQRIAQLPDDVRAARLVRIEIGVRPAEPRVTSASPLIEIERLRTLDVQADAAGRVAENMLRVPADEHLSNDTAVLAPDGHELRAGDVLMIRLIPGDDQTSSWEYAITPDRKPYGGWVASGPDNQPKGSLAYTTTFERDVDTTDIVAEAGDRVATLPSSDAAFLIAYGGTSLATLGVAAGLVTRRRREG